MGNSYKYPFINKKEFQSLLFYQGASDHIELDPSESVLEDFYSIDNGYETTECGKTNELGESTDVS